MITEKNINKMIHSAKRFNWLDTDEITDGYHTFGELYAHRNMLFISFCKAIYDNQQKDAQIWRKPIEDGYFLMGIGTEKGNQISYHLPENLWSYTDFLEVNHESDYEFDGHTPHDVLTRLKRKING